MIHNKSIYLSALKITNFGLLVKNLQIFGFVLPSLILSVKAVFNQLSQLGSVCWSENIGALYSQMGHSVLKTAGQNTPGSLNLRFLSKLLISPTSLEVS